MKGEMKKLEKDFEKKGKESIGKIDEFEKTTQDLVSG